MTALAVDQDWRAVPVDGGVELTAGGDLVYRLRDLPPAEAAFLVVWFGSSPTGDRTPPNTSSRRSAARSVHK